jgi:site-specific DNA-cytosine methylase
MDRPAGNANELDFLVPDVGKAVLTRQGNRNNVEEDNFIAYNWQSGGDVRHNFGKPTLQANQTAAVGIRRLTPTECERLQGFPDGWTDGQSDSARYRQLGNAVAVPVVEWIGKRINTINSKKKGETP